ncbi:N-acetyl-1-D-myo-inositol-2-amino-2-deoxy-alpha-D-glucopyranoside deacetylase [Corynebacterium sp. sy017]|uniref:N-acetyl-1-D-myo-inositol-2-amino-2-deoxy-alpha- D-glucopyranoside deacetylase n=1 Tax=unclassified Corynebacterium TaxID=2624378 RepID=UPI001184DA1D|nr:MULTISPECIES: N-acetyl-1-D-myo-inositol-2-amino-2-deoxy-alpha-D-glucopyranoside deacetylase [unclassified Corynebacterium]MBP3088946.1 N-acetyl-1-D-myo-inositol-2-amino-2-deoxy-alpha-D-glucopyranoside deacetylase [Corynebacterium sp. sy017]TSD91522.1 N-acetyl-1-D-myo-inositol-2-amino-2-deoxy-alpha-D-glucopyranoside deacetylase [Corynebacterium sp. SY003]
MGDLDGKKVVAVHAHPDDEAIWTGGLLAQLVRRGADVLVVTCTLGEQGEVFGEKYGQLVAEYADQLGGFRIHELHRSLEILGVRGQFLGAPGQWRDSGMQGDPANDHPRAFINSGADAVQQLCEIFQYEQPDLVVTYGPDGGYGHPDHIRAHHITHEAAQVVTIPRILWAVTGRTELDLALRAFDAPDGWHKPDIEELASVSQYDISVALTHSDVAKKIAAMRSHATQLAIADGKSNDVHDAAYQARIHDRALVAEVFALTNRLARPIMRTEEYQIGAQINDYPCTDVMAGL